MNLGVLNETVVLIDTDFLNERIYHNLDFYQNLYPDKVFKRINLAELLYKFVLNARIEEAGNNVDILFAFSLSNSNLYYCKPNDVFDFIDGNNVRMETEIGTFVMRSFFTDEDETCSEFYCKMLSAIDNSSRVSRIIMIADNQELNTDLEIIYEKGEKNLFMLKKSQETEIEIPVKYVDIDYPIAYSLGLKRSEI